MRYRALLAVLLFHQLVACADIARASHTRVFLTDLCPSGTTYESGESAAMAALATAVLPSVIEKSYEALSAAVRKAGEKKTKTYAAEHNFHFYRSSGGDGSDVLPGKELGCIVLFEAEFEKAEVDVSSNGSTKGQVMTTLAEDYNVAKEPAFYMEFVPVASQDSSAFALHLVFAHYPEPLSGAKYKDSVMAIEFYRPGDTADKPFASSLISLSGISGSSWRRVHSSNSNSRWMTMPAFPKAVSAAFSEVRALDSEIQSLEYKLRAQQGTASKSEINKTVTALDILNDKRSKAVSSKRTLTTKFLPATLVASLRETKDANAFLIGLADALDSSKDGVVDAVKSSVIPKSDEEIAKEIEKQETLGLNATIARQAVERATLSLELADPADRKAYQQLEQTLERTRLEANSAYRKAGWSIPYPLSTPSLEDNL